MLMMTPPLLRYFWFHSIYSLAASCSLQSAVCGLQSANVIHRCIYTEIYRLESTLYFEEILFIGLEIRVFVCMVAKSIYSLFVSSHVWSLLCYCVRATGDHCRVLCDVARDFLFTWYYRALAIGSGPKRSESLIIQSGNWFKLAGYQCLHQNKW